MILKRIISIILVLSLLLVSFTGATGGSQTDPVVTKSYMTQTFMPSILSDAKKLIDTAFTELYAKCEQLFDAPLAGLYAAAYLRQGKITLSNNGEPATYRIGAGSVVSGNLGTMITLIDGSATTYAPNGNVIINTTDAVAYSNNNKVIPMNRYIIADEGNIGIKASSDCVVTVSGNYCIIGTTSPYATSDKIDSSNYIASYTKYAHALNVLGLFKGTNKGFDLEKSATRAEALTMLIRILGEESDALAYTGSHPFNDVPSWADRYVAYGYNKGYTTGISTTKFGSSDTVSAVQYLTFLLRALGYSDADGDFVWNESDTAALRFGLLNESDASVIRSIFLRDQMVLASYKALYTNIKGANTLLITKLTSDGVISVEAVYQAELIIG